MKKSHRTGCCIPTTDQIQHLRENKHVFEFVVNNFLPLVVGHSDFTREHTQKPVQHFTSISDEAYTVTILHNCLREQSREKRNHTNQLTTSTKCLSKNGRDIIDRFNDMYRKVEQDRTRNYAVDEALVLNASKHCHRRHRKRRREDPDVYDDLSVS